MLISKENKCKIIIIAVFSLCMAVLFRVYSKLGEWIDIIENGLGKRELVGFIFGNWQIWMMCIFITALTSLFVFCESARKIVYKYRYAIAGVVFVLCVIFELSGSSIGHWCNYFNSKDSEVIFGVSRTIRSDEFCLTTPYFFSQIMSGSPNAFDYFSDYANGYESDLFMGIRQPIKHILTVFRPFTLGFLFLSPAKGLSFWWCSKLITLFLATFEMGMILTNKRKSLSFIMALLVTFAPVVQWWFSTSVAEIIIYTEVAMILFNRYIVETRFWKRLLLLVGILFTAGCFIMLLYPSWQVPFVYVILVLTGWIIYRNYKNNALKWFDYVSIAVGLAGLVLVFRYIFMESSETIELISNTVYPGERMETGGGRLGYIFTYPIDTWFSIVNSEFGVNMSEDATVFDFFPFSIVLPIVVMIKNRRKDIISILLLGLSFFFFVWIAFGFPPVIAKITFMSNSQAIRTAYAFGFVNILLLIRSISLMKEPFKLGAAVGISIGISVLVMGISYVVAGNNFMSSFEKKLLLIVTIVLMFLLILSFMIYNRKHMSLIAILLVMIVVMMGGVMVNPIRKGVESVYEIPWVESIQNTCKKEGKNDIWVVECSDLEALPYVNVGLLCGVKTFNATAVYPNMELWQKLDTDGEYSDVYNRYSHIGVYIKASGEPEFELLTTDCFKLYITFEDLKKVGVTYITGLTDLSEYIEESQCKVTLIDDSNGIYIYRIE